MPLYFAENVRYLIKKRKLKQADIAAVVGKKQSSVSNWLNGVSEPALSDIVKISQLLDVEVGQLMLSDLSAGNTIHPVQAGRRTENSSEREIIESQQKIISLLEDSISLKDKKIVELRTEVQELTGRVSYFKAKSEKVKREKKTNQREK